MPRPFALVRTEDQWRRAAHLGTALVGDVVQLSWTNEPRQDLPPGAPLPGAGLAFDEHCRLFHSVPEEGRVERLLWAAAGKSAPLELFAQPESEVLGDFEASHPAEPILDSPRGLAVDPHERLFIAEAGRRRILVFDLWTRRLLRVVPMPGRPVDLASHGPVIHAVLESPDRIVTLNAVSHLRIETPSGGFDGPARVAVSPAGERLLLERAGTAQARILSPGRPPIEVPRATDLEFLSSEELVVARHPGEDFLRFRVSPGALEEVLPLKAARYDGRGIVRTPDGRIAFWTDLGVRHAVAARVRYGTRGRVTTFRLDSGNFRTVWGRLFLDACVPRETRILVHTVSTDETSAEPTLPRTGPENAVTLEIRRPDLSPAMPPLSLVPGDDEVVQTLHRRERGRELPWTPFAPDDPMATYEAPIRAAPGRYLWVTVQLEGNTRFTPRFRCLRAEYPTHDLLRRIPKVYSRQADQADFLRRALASFEGVLSQLDAEAVARHAWIDPRGVPEEALPWLAGFLGLALDPRWPVSVRRQLIEECTWLFRFRGTVPGLLRFLRICLQSEVILIEKFRVRGLGGALVGESSSLEANSVLGAGFRIGGAIGTSESVEVRAGTDDAFETHAHRFSVIIPRALDEDQLAAVAHLLEVHRPAHTLVEVCTVGAGMRVGRGLHVGLTSLIGRTSGFQSLQLDNAVLGRGAIVGRPGPGISPGASRTGYDTRIG
ncbi:MAG: phage tail protein [Limisphaerales bacterium]